MVVEDTVRADALSVYGNPRPTSPQLAEVARVGVTFDDVTAPSSWTWPTHASLFTGLMPWEHGAHFGAAEDEGVWSLDPLPLLVTMPRSDVPTLAERFADAGYRTVVLTGNPIVGPDLAAMVRGFELAEVRLYSCQTYFVRSLEVSPRPSSFPGCQVQEINKCRKIT